MSTDGRKAFRTLKGLVLIPAAPRKGTLKFTSCCAALSCSRRRLRPRPSTSARCAPALRACVRWPIPPGGASRAPAGARRNARPPIPKYLGRIAEVRRAGCGGLAQRGALVVRPHSASPRARGGINAGAPAAASRPVACADPQPHSLCDSLSVVCHLAPSGRLDWRRRVEQGADTWTAAQDGLCACPTAAAVAWLRSRTRDGAL